jgi:hypothetical protein
MIYYTCTCAICGDSFPEEEFSKEDQACLLCLNRLYGNDMEPTFHVPDVTATEELE